MSVVDRVRGDPELLWATAVGALTVALVGGSIAFPRTVYTGFVWQYFWGPVQADAHSAACAVRSGGVTEYLAGTSACQAAAGTVAYPGYTVVSEVGYAVVLLVAIVGVIFMLRRLDIGTDRRFFFALVPFSLFGGALRVVEDATDTGAAAELLTYPLNTLVISPIIYVTVFVVTLVAVLATVWLDRGGVVDDYARPLFAAGVLAVLLTLAYLFSLSSTADVRFYPQVLGVILVLATGSAVGVYALVDRYAPYVTAGTQRIGLVVIWGHAVDGAANMVGLDWLTRLGAGPNLVPKHPANKYIVEATAAILPESIQAVTGAAWGFLAVKLVVAALVLWAFDEQLFEESPRSTVLILVAVLAVGLGPGTRDALRATLGV